MEVEEQTHDCIRSGKGLVNMEHNHPPGSSEWSHAPSSLVLHHIVTFPRLSHPARRAIARESGQGGPSESTRASGRGAPDRADCNGCNVLALRVSDRCHELEFSGEFASKCQGRSREQMMGERCPQRCAVLACFRLSLAFISSSFLFPSLLRALSPSPSSVLHLPSSLLHLLGDRASSKT